MSTENKELTDEEMQERERIYTEQIEPLIAQLEILCDQHNFPYIFALQLFVDAERGARISIQQLLTPEATGHFVLAARILRGEMPVVPLSNAFAGGLEGILSQVRNQLTEVARERAAACDQCQAEMERRAAAGEDLSNVNILTEISEQHESQRHSIKNELSDALEGAMGAFFGETKSKIVH